MQPGLRARRFSPRAVACVTAGARETGADICGDEAVFPQDGTLKWAANGVLLRNSMSQRERQASGSVSAVAAAPSALAECAVPRRRAPARARQVLPRTRSGKTSIAARPRPAGGTPDAGRAPGHPLRPPVTPAGNGTLTDADAPEGPLNVLANLLGGRAHGLEPGVSPTRAVHDTA